MRHVKRRSLFVALTGFGVAAGAIGAAYATAACSTAAPRSSFEEPDASVDTGTAPPPFVDTDAFAPKGDCNGGPDTSISGVVYDPAGVTPLYNVIVYVPTKAVDPFPPSGATCDRCGTVTSGAPKVTALTNAKGEFKLVGAPVGTDIPLVIQVGKWRRQVTLPKVEKCKDTKADKELTRLPKNKSEGDMPQIALATGALDALECLIRKFGIDDSEFTNETKDGKVHIYQGNTQSGSFSSASTAPGGSTPSRVLWQTKNNLLKYDILMLSCEGDEPFGDKGADSLGGAAISRGVLYDYANAGGRIFGTHFNYYWFKYGPPAPDGNFRATADWADTSSSGSTYNVDTSFPKGKDFADWLVNVGASITPGKIELKSVSSDVGAVKPGTERWIYQGNSTKYLSFNTPQGKDPKEQCGRAVFSDIHVAIDDKRGPVFPTECVTTSLSPQEQALEFLFFDLSSCVQDESKPPQPPK